MIKYQTRRVSRALMALLAIVMVITALVIANIRYGGPIERKHALQSEMLADILPPPAFVVEPFLHTTLIALDPRQAKNEFAKLRTLEAEFRGRQRYWRTQQMPAAMHTQLDRVIWCAAQFWRSVDTELRPAVQSGKPERIRHVQREYLTPLFNRQHAEVLKLVAMSNAFSAHEKHRDGWIVAICLGVAAVLAGLALTSLFLASRMVERRVVTPLDATTRAIGVLAGGSFDVTVPNLEHTDEFGSMARAMEVFRKSGIAKQESDRAQQKVVSELTRGLRKLAEKDLEYRIEEEGFPRAYEQLRENFNSALEALARVMGTVRVGAGSVMRAIGEIRAASDDLAIRNQQQAASLEETAAAMNQVNGRVRQSASTAAEAQTSISSAHGQASEGGEVVQQAIAAMAMIEQSSQQISSIVNVIDGIAFQTNLLALNAGVEAARAGDAGKGFAVVANEVRALAQRSADAAQDIKQLIETSSTQVGHGVELVGQTGAKLAEIVNQVADLRALIGTMTESAHEQASSLDQVNTAVNEMDRMTQQNAAMVEETSAATRSLETEAQSLTKMMSSFRTRVKETRPQGTAGTDGLRRNSSVNTPDDPVAAQPFIEAVNAAARAA